MIIRLSVKMVSINRTLHPLLSFNLYFSLVTKLQFRYAHILLGVRRRLLKYCLFAILKLTNFWIMFSLMKVPKNSTYDRIFISKNQSPKNGKKAVFRHPTSDPLSKVLIKNHTQSTLTSLQNIIFYNSNFMS